jgi:hypothetical protein
MLRRPTLILTCLIAGLLTACGGGSKSSPILPAAPAPAASATAPAANVKSRASFVITVPKPSPTPQGKLRPAYVSPATQSMTVSITQGSTSVISQTVGLTASSTGCSSSLSSLTCTLSLNLNPGSYTASITTYDGTNGSGNALSTAQNVAFTVTADQNNVVPLSLSGIPANILVERAGADSIYVLAQDADGNFIVGTGAPTFTAAKTAGTAIVTITQPTTSAPNTVAFALPSPPATGTETIGVTASYPTGQTNACTETGAVCSLTSAATATYSSGSAFMPNYEANDLLGYTLPLTSNTQAPFTTISGVAEYPYWGIALNSNTSEVFSWGYWEGNTTLVGVLPPYTAASVTNGSTGLYDAYGYGAAAPNGDLFIPNYPTADGSTGAVGMIVAPYTSTATQITAGVDEPAAATADSSSNLYVANGGSHTVTVYASPYTSGPAATVSTTAAPLALAISGSKLYVGEVGYIDVFSLPLSSSSTPVATLTIAGEFYSLALDAKGNLWGGCYAQCADTEGAVYEFTTPLSTGQSPTVTLNMPASGFSSYYPVGIGFDAVGNLYVNNGYGGADEGGLLEYSGTITSSSTPAYGVETSTLYYPWGLVITPATLTVSP